MSEYQAGVIVDGRYRVISRIGAGGMADVYLAEDLQLSREVALKLLHRRFAEDPGFVERFRREAQSAAGLQHPNVVSVFDRGAFDDTYYIAMEHLQGRTLKQLIREEAPLDPERAIDLTIQILKAARFAHRRGVIHRDLKPHNVIVDSGDHAKVTDFGIARAGASDMTETGSIMGTAQYLSPEQAQGYPVSAPSDLYSVAIVLYEMLTGQVPFDGESAVSIALKQVSEPPIPPSRLNPEVPQSLEQVVMWALNKDPADRPSDADDFIAALEQARELMGSSVSDVTAAMRAIGPVTVATVISPPTEAFAAPGTALVPYGASTSTYGSATNLDTATNGKEPDEKPEDDGNGIWPWLIGLAVLLLIIGGVLAYLLTRPSKVQVPDLVGLSLPVAEAHLSQDGLTYSSPIYTYSTKPVNQVIGQSPDAEASVKSGTSVLLTVSNGPGAVSVPSVVQMTASQAIKAIKAQGLTVSRIVYQSSGSTPKGDAISTQPEAGTNLAKGKGVVLFVSSGLKVPDVSGDTIAQAQQALSRFNVDVVKEVATGVRNGTVFKQTPVAHTSAASGSTVTIYVAKKPASTTTNVPSVVGYTERGATNTIRDAGLKVAYKNELVSSANEVGNVVRQSPSGSSTVQKGSTVTLYIGKAKPKPPPPTPTKTTTTPTTSTVTTTTT